MVSLDRDPLRVSSGGSPTQQGPVGRRGDRTVVGTRKERKDPGGSGDFTLPGEGEPGRTESETRTLHRIVGRRSSAVVLVHVTPYPTRPPTKSLGLRQKGVLLGLFLMLYGFLPWHVLEWSLHPRRTPVVPLPSFLPGPGPGPGPSHDHLP